MGREMISGNEAVAYAALASGAKVICGYPGTPSSEVIGSLMKMPDFAGTHIEWSVNEKVAVEIAATNAWAGKRSLCTMKMSGLNVAYDSMIGIAHSGVIAGMVVYVCDDPGVTTGMCEQDSRGFAIMSDMVMLEPGTVKETYEMVRGAFALSEELKMPVFVRSVTNVAQSHQAVEIEERMAPDPSAPIVKKDILKYAKAGAAMCMAQHNDAIQSLILAGKLFGERKVHDLHLGKAGGLGIVAVGVTKCYLEEALEIALNLGCNVDGVSMLKARCTVPYPSEEIKAVLSHCGNIVVIEELEPYLEREVYVQAQIMGTKTKIVGKLDGTLSRIGAYNAAVVAKAICSACETAFPEELLTWGVQDAAAALARPITCCAGCPHRGTYMAINTAIKKAGYKKEEVIVTGDIGCTILGMNPPFDTIWMEISMGASIPCAQGFSYSGVDKPIIATIGDSTFFHNGIPGLVNAVQHNIDVTVVIMDNGWTAMTGMQVNPNTAQEFQRGEWKHIDLVDVVKALGVEDLYIVDSFDQKATTAAFDACLAKKGLKVIVTRRECAIQSNRRGIKYNYMRVDEDKCVNCKACVRITGCPALSVGENAVSIDPAVCNGCTLCYQTCPKQAIVKEEVKAK